MFRYRDHRGMFDESMATAQQMSSITDLEEHICSIYGEGLIEVKNYGGMDERCGWDTHIVTHNGCACGFTDGPVDANMRTDKAILNWLQNECKGVFSSERLGDSKEIEVFTIPSQHVRGSGIRDAFSNAMSKCEAHHE